MECTETIAGNEKIQKDKKRKALSSESNPKKKRKSVSDDKTFQHRKRLDDTEKLFDIVEAEGIDVKSGNRPETR